jgi:hypothetical protein
LLGDITSVGCGCDDLPVAPGDDGSDLYLVNVRSGDERRIFIARADGSGVRQLS